MVDGPPDLHSYVDSNPGVSDVLRKLFGLEGKTALVTGAAGGLGRAICLGLAQAGAAVAVADLTEDGVKTVVEEIRRDGGVAVGERLDVTVAENVQEVVARISAELGDVDILVNAAGVTKRAPAELFPEAVWDHILDVNLKGLFLTSQAVGRDMIERGRGGRIVNIASIAAEAGLPHTIAYCASKGGVVQVTRTMALEWAPHNILVNAVAPSWFETTMGQAVNDPQELYVAGTVPSGTALYDSTVGRVPLKRHGRVDELVGAVIFLASPAASMITGHVLAVDGGYLAQ